MATSYSIGKHFEAFIESLVASGRYSTASEIIRDGLRLIEEREQDREAKLEWLRVEIQKGLDSGPDANSIRRRLPRRSRRGDVVDLRRRNSLRRRMARRRISLPEAEHDLDFDLVFHSNQ